MIKEYSYFSYNANEALHLSEQERRTVVDCLSPNYLSDLLKKQEGITPSEYRLRMRG